MVIIINLSKKKGGFVLIKKGVYEMDASVNSATTDSGIVKFFVQRLPSHLKRIVFLASITGAANNSKEPDAEFISKLNSILNLSDSGDGALKLPIYVNGIIWKYKENIQSDLDVLKDPMTDDCQKHECISRIEKSTSSWLKYADSETIMKDLYTLFNTSNNIFAPVKI